MIARCSGRMLTICRQAGATTYLSGPAAQGYLAEDLFAEQGIGVRWMDYSGYPEYDQLHPPFEHGVAVLDLILQLGDRAAESLKSPVLPGKLCWSTIAFRAFGSRALLRSGSITDRHRF